MENLTKIDSVWKLGDNVVEHFLNSECSRGKKYENNSRSFSIGTDNEENELKLSKHHVIPFEFIDEQIGKYITFVKNNRTQNEGHFNALKRKLQRILNHPEIQRDFDEYFGDSNEMADKDNEAARRLREHIVWYPENLFIGPEGHLRSYDSESGIDFDVLLGLEKFDENAFFEFNYWIDMTDVKTNGLDKLASKLVTENITIFETKGVKTIIDVLYSLNKGNLATYGPPWNKSGSDGKWLTHKSYPKKVRTGLVRRDLTNPVKVIGETLKKVKKVNIQNGELEWENGQEEDEEFCAKDYDENEDQGYATGVDETAEYVGDSKDKIEEDRKIVKLIRDDYGTLENSAKKLVHNLESIANYVESIHKNCNTGKKIGTGVSATGSVLNIAGGIVTALTGGLAAPILIIGASVCAIAGSTTNSTSTLIEVKKNKKKLIEAEKELIDFQKLHNRFLKKIEELTNYYISKELWRIRTFLCLFSSSFEVDKLGLVAMKDAFRLKKWPIYANKLVIGLLPIVQPELTNMEPFSEEAVIGALTFILPQTKASQDRVVVTKMITKNVVRSAVQVAKSSGKVASGATAAVGSGIILIWDIICLIKLCNDKGSAAAKCIREARDDLKKRIENNSLGV